MILLSQNVSLWKTLFNSDVALDITLSGFLLILFSSLVCGLIFSGLYLYLRKKESLTSGIALALVVVPMATAVVIAMVGRNIATGLGLSGIFVLVRFRSGPVETKDLSYLFASICSGVLSGCGYVAYSLIFTAIMFLVILVLEQSSWGRGDADNMLLKIWIPENLDYQGTFDPVLEEYLNMYKLLMVRTTDFGSMVELRYRVRLKEDINQKEFLDEIRQRNGNMNVVLIVAPNIVGRSGKQVL